MVENSGVPMLRDGNVIAGEIWKRQKKIDKSLSNDQPEEAVDNAADSDAGEEVQFFLGNKHEYGRPFVFVDADKIQEMTYPEEIMVAELDHGPAIFFPQKIVPPEGDPIPASDRREFEKTLRDLIKTGQKQNQELEKLTRKEIGDINRDIQELERDLEGHEQGSSQYQELQSEIQELQRQYDETTARANQLREDRIKHQIVYNLATGQEITKPIYELRHFYSPNDIGLFGKLGVFLHNVWVFISEDPREANQEGGIFPAIFGTFVMTLLMSIAVTPFGVIAAIYLREYAKEGMLVKSVRICVNNLAGVPSIVFGMFGLAFFVYLVGGSIDNLFFPDKVEAGTPVYGTGGILWASLTLALLTLPVVIVATEEGLVAVPRGTREAALACGASKWQMIQRVVLPGAAPGILTGLILAMARGAGEVAPLMLVGVVKIAQSLPVDGEAPYVHPERKFLHLGFHIFDLGFQSPDAEAAKPMVFATTFLLIFLVIVLNLGAIMIRNQVRKKYTTGAF
jgi:phosphate transport system permease protein